MDNNGIIEKLYKNKTLWRGLLLNLWSQISKKKINEAYEEYMKINFSYTLNLIFEFNDVDRVLLS